MEAAAGAAEARKARARETLQAFADAAKAAGVDAEILEPEVEAGSAARRAAAIRARVRIHDDPAARPRAARRRATISPPRCSPRAAGRSGSCPPSSAAPAQFKRIVIAWDGGAAAARAFSEAKPIIRARRAGRDRQRQWRAHASHAVIQGGERLAARLTRRASRANSAACRATKTPPTRCCPMPPTWAPISWSAAATAIRRLRESLFGGATRTFLTSMTLPMFFAHD